MAKTKKALARLIGERIRLLRKKKGLSQEELAHLSSLHPTYIGQLERGEKNATLHTVEKVTNALDISIEELFQFNNQKDTLLELNNYLNRFSGEDRETILKILDILLEWKDRTKTKSPI